MKSEESFFVFDCEENSEDIAIRDNQSLMAMLEAKRLSEKYGKDTFVCEDLQRILGLGKNNVRSLLNSEDFPSIKVGNRKFVSAISLASWLNRR